MLSHCGQDNGNHTFSFVTAAAAVAAAAAVVVGGVSSCFACDRHSLSLSRRDAQRYL